MTAEQIVRSAVAEDADVIGISSLSGGLGHFAVNVIERLRAEEAEIPVIAGGIDEPAEVERMLQQGVYRYFGPSSETEAVVRAFGVAREGASPSEGGGVPTT